MLRAILTTGTREQKVSFALANNKQQTTNNKPQTTNHKQQTTNHKQQTTNKIS